MASNVRADKVQLFEKMPVSQAVITLAIPAVVSNLVVVIYSMADTYFIGMVNDPVQNAGVTLVSPVLLAFNAVNNLFGAGGSSMMGLSMGRYDYETTKKTSAFCFYGAGICGLLFSLLCLVFNTPLLHLLGADEETWSASMQYLLYAVIFGAIPSILNVVTANLFRAEGLSLHASIGTMSGCVLNMILDPLFILVFHMGAAGAGIATCIGNAGALLYYLILHYVKRKTTLVCMDPRRAMPTANVLRGVCGVGIPASIQNLLNVTSMTLLNNLAAVYGASAVAAIGIAQKVNQFPMMTALGACQGAAPLVGYNYSAGNGKRMKETILFLTKLMMPFLICASVLIYVFSEPIVGLFIENEEVVLIGLQLLRGLTIAVPFLCIDFMGVTVYQAIGRGKISLVFAIARKIILEIPALVILNRILPLYGLSYAQFVSEFILSIAAFLMLRSIVREAAGRQAVKDS